MEEPCGWLSLRPGHAYSKPGYMERPWVFSSILCTCVHHCHARATLPLVVLNPPFCCGSIQQYGLRMKTLYIRMCKRCWGCYGTDCKVGRYIWAVFQLARWMPGLAFLLGQGRAPGGLGDSSSSALCKLHPFLHWLYPALLTQHPQCGCNSCSRSGLTTWIHVARKLTLSPSG